MTSGWLGLVDLAIGIDTFGASGPGEQVMAELGLTSAAVSTKITEFLTREQA